MTDAMLRSLELIDFSSMPELRVNIIGMGAVGSRVFEQLVCLGARNIGCYDFDHVEGHNLHNQLFFECDVGVSKVEAASDWLALKYGIDPDDTNIDFNEMKVETEHVADMSGIIMLCVDSFGGREDIAKAAANNPNILLVVEGRCAPSFVDVRHFNPRDEESLDKFLSSLGNDDDPEPYVSFCGLPISFAPVMTVCGCMMVMQAVNFLKQGRIFPSNQFNKLTSSPMLEMGCSKL